MTVFCRESHRPRRWASLSRRGFDAERGFAGLGRFRYPELHRPTQISQILGPEDLEVLVHRTARRSNRPESLFSRRP